LLENQMAALDPDHPTTSPLLFKPSAPDSDPSAAANALMLYFMSPPFWASLLRTKIAL